MECTSHSRRGAVHARNVKHLTDKYESNISKRKDALSDEEQRKDFWQRVSPSRMDDNSELLRNGMRGEKGREKGGERVWGRGEGYGGRGEGGREGGGRGEGRGGGEGKERVGGRGEGRGGKGLFIIYLIHVHLCTNLAARPVIG